MQSETIINGRRRTRSASSPPSGASSEPAAKVKNVSPAAALAFPVYGSRDVVAAAAAGQLAAMSYAAVITLRYLARERA